MVFLSLHTYSAQHPTEGLSVETLEKINPYFLHVNNKNYYHTSFVGILHKTFLNNASQSLWLQSIWSSWAAPRDKQTVLHCLKLLFNRELIETANAPREKKEIKLNPPNLYPGTDSFIFGSLAVSQANKMLLKGRINTEQGCVCSGSRVHNWQETLQLHSLQSCFWIFQSINVPLSLLLVYPPALPLCKVFIQL